MTGKQPNERRLRELWDFGEQLEELRAHLPERKTERLQLRVTPTEKEEIEWLTDLLGISVADYLMHFHRRALKELEQKLERDERLGEQRERLKRRRDHVLDARRRRRKGGPRRRRDDDEGVLV